MATYEMRLSLIELYKLLFKSKKCAHCGVKMVRVKNKTDQGYGWHADTSSEENRVEYGQKYDYAYTYRCHGCSRSVALRNL